jgi:hypothetical protein
MRMTLTPSQKEDDETETAELKLTRALIDTVPKLVSKHQADPVRVSVVLELAGLMHLPIYAEMRATDVSTTMDVFSAADPFRPTSDSGAISFDSTFDIPTTLFFSIFSSFYDPSWLQPT